MATRKKSESTSESDIVFVMVPKAFQLTTDDRTLIHVKAGAQKMERSLATHWYAKANKVTIID